MRAERAMALLALSLAALALLLFATWLAARARRPRVPRPRRRSFEHGRHLARARRAVSLEAAVGALRSGAAGELVELSLSDEGAAVTIRRRRRDACAQTAGAIAGLFESAWAEDVAVEHPSCAGPRGGACAYTVRRASARLDAAEI